jgi:hypothetical protein
MRVLRPTALSKVLDLHDFRKQRNVDGGDSGLCVIMSLQDFLIL